MTTYRFFPPVADEEPIQHDHEFLSRISWPRGLSVVRDEDGLFIIDRFHSPRPGEIEGRDYFVGGFHYRGIPQEIANQLADSGFEAEPDTDESQWEQ